MATLNYSQKSLVIPITSIHFWFDWTLRSSKLSLILVPTRFSSSCLISDQKWAADLFSLLHLPFGTLSLSIFVPQIHHQFSKVYSRPFHIKSVFRLSYHLSIACTMSPRFSTYTLTMDSLQSLPCISHIASFLQNIWIAWRKRLRCLHLKTERALNSLLLLPDGVTVKTSPIGWVATARACDQKLWFTAPQFVKYNTS